MHLRYLFKKVHSLQVLDFSEIYHGCGPDYIILMFKRQDQISMCNNNELCAYEILKDFTIMVSSLNDRLKLFKTLQFKHVALENKGGFSFFFSTNIKWISVKFRIILLVVIIYVSPFAIESSGVTGGAGWQSAPQRLLTGKFLLTYWEKRGKEKRENGSENKANLKSKVEN